MVIGSQERLRDIVIEFPGSAEYAYWFKTSVAETIQSAIAVQATTSGAGVGNTLQVKSGTSFNLPTTTHINSTMVVNSGTGHPLTISDASIPANSYVVLTTTAVSGTPQALSVNIISVEN